MFSLAYGPHLEVGMGSVRSEALVGDLRGHGSRAALELPERQVTAPKSEAVAPVYPPADWLLPRGVDD
jgi:hypothetical protein